MTHALVFRAATWLFAALAATMNYWHAADPGLRPNGEAVSYGAMSLAGVVLWELLSTYRHRSRQRDAGTLPPRRPRFGLARWVWFPRVTHLARLLALREGHTRTEPAWAAALDAAARHGSVRAAIAILRLRRPIAAACPACAETRAEILDETEKGTSGPTGVETTGETSRRPATATWAETSTEVAGETPAETNPDTRIETLVEPTRLAGGEAPPVVEVVTEPVSTATSGNGHRAAGLASVRTSRLPSDQLEARGGQAPRRRPGGVKAKVIRYVERQQRAGRTVTGAELDRRFGTSNYGSRILRALAAQRSHPE